MFPSSCWKCGVLPWLLIWRYPYINHSFSEKDRARPVLASRSVLEAELSPPYLSQPCVVLSNQLIAHKTGQNDFSICHKLWIDQQVMKSLLYLFLHCKMESALHLFNAFPTCSNRHISKHFLFMYFIKLCLLHLGGKNYLQAFP